MGSEAAPRALLIPKNEIEDKFSVIRLKHPQSGSTALCALDSTNNLYEIADFTEEFAPWFVDNPVAQSFKDGNLYLLKFVDPLFFILPYGNTDKKFYPIEDLLVDEDFPDVHKLIKCCSYAQLSNIFDTKKSSGVKVFCYNKAKTLDWLQCKADCLASSLKDQGIDIPDDSKSTSLQTDVEKYEALLNCSCLMISDFITEELSIELYKSLGLQVKQEKSKNENNLQGESKKQNTAVSPSVCKIPELFKNAKPGWIFLGVIGVLLGSIGYFLKKL